MLNRLVDFITLTRRHIRVVTVGVVVLSAYAVYERHHAEDRSYT